MAESRTCASCGTVVGAVDATCSTCGAAVQRRPKGMGAMPLALMIAGGAAAVAIVAALLFGTSVEPSAPPTFRESVGLPAEVPAGASSDEDIRRFLRNKSPAEQDCLIEEYRARLTDEQIARIVNLGPVKAAEVAEMEAAGAIC